MDTLHEKFVRFAIVRARVIVHAFNHSSLDNKKNEHEDTRVGTSVVRNLFNKRVGEANDTR